MMCLSLLGCSDNGSSEQSESIGYAPKNLIGQTLVLKSGSTKILSVKHKSETTLILNSNSADYSNPPSYEYSVEGDNKALYYIDFYLKTYSGYYHDYIYYNCVYDIELDFTSPKSGTFRGTQMKDAKESNISGTFTLSIVEDNNDDNGNDDDDDDDDDDDNDDDNDTPSETINISISKCSFGEITSNSVQVAGTVKVEGNAQISERGFIYGTQDNLTIGNGTKIQSSKTLDVPVNETITNLNSTMCYYVRQYVICNSKTTYGEVSSFVTKENTTDNNEDNIDYSIEPIYTICIF